MKNWEKEAAKCMADPQYFYETYWIPVKGTDTELFDRAADFAIKASTEINLIVRPDSQEDVNSFIDYWITHTQRGRKLRFEKEITFDIPARFRTWMRNKKKFATVKLANRIFGGPRG